MTGVQKIFWKPGTLVVYNVLDLCVLSLERTFYEFRQSQDKVLVYLSDLSGSSTKQHLSNLLDNLY